MIGKTSQKFSNDWKNGAEKFPTIGKSSKGWKEPGWHYFLLGLLFFASGLSALLYQVVWSKRLVQVFGASGVAVATTLSVFMLGLALGAGSGGRAADRMKRPLLWYALMEAGIAFCAYCSGMLLDRLSLVLAGMNTVWMAGMLFGVFRFAGVFAILFVPTFLMGMTFPVLVRQCVLLGNGVARRTGWLYALNTAGGVPGCLLTGFVLIGRAGLHGALMTGVMLNAAVALIALGVSICVKEGPSGDGDVERTSKSVRGADRDVRITMLIAFFCAGFAALGVECVWTRMLLFHLNSTAQAFSAMLAVVLMGMALGSWASAGRAQRCGESVTRYGMALMGGALCMVVCLSVWAYMTSGKIFAKAAGAVYASSPDVWQVPLWNFLLRIMIPTVVLAGLPAFVMGVAFPFAARFFTEQKGIAGRSFGGAYMLNTLGCMSGPLVVGFILLPWLGMQLALLICAGMLLAAGCLVRVGAGVMKGWQGVTAVALYAVVAMLLPERILFSLFSDRAMFFDEAVLEQEGLVIGHEGSNRIIFHEEDHCGSVLVMEQDVPGAGLKLRRLYVGPTSMITDNFAAQRYTKLIGHLPVLLAENPQRALVICLGTGMTLSGVAAHEMVEQIDCAELSPAVTRAVHCYDHVNGNVLDDPRLNLVVNDGRTHLTLSRENYDVIALEPPPPSNEGAANLYSREFYELCYQRLNAGGVVSQWLPFHLLTKEQVRSLSATMQKVFPTVLLWEIYPGTEFCLIGIKGEGKMPYERVAERLNASRVRESLEPIGVRGVGDLMNCFVAGTERVRQLAEDAKVVTDDRPVVGYDLNNLGLLTEYDPQGTAMQNSLMAFEHKKDITDVFDFGDEDRLDAFVAEYIKVRGAYLMDRKLAVIASLGMDAFIEQFGENQALLPPPKLDGKNTMYQTRPRITVYIQALNRLAAYYNKQCDPDHARAYLQAVDAMRKLLPASYCLGSHFLRIAEHH